MYGKNKRPLSLYKTLTDLSSVLSRFNIFGSSLAIIPQFIPSSISLLDDKELQQCMKKIKHRLRNMRTLVPDSNKAMHNEYISSILHVSINVVRRITDKEISLFS
ncbi:hypothetical protein GLOIN_2v1476258 [Rhizophagus clarus]|uniref:Uncharacterized protein n=1 Tax=Rhizophagus clarus TaxID=94130 RepID=A0A8H3KTL0_9GLOM|nr:hypothetical protein GLOIN_2v1476258 [Rhizophagus clarus]